MRSLRAVTALLLFLATTTVFAQDLPIRVAGEVGQLVPAETTRPVLITIVAFPQIAEDGTLNFWARSEARNRFPHQHLLDTRGTAALPMAERKLTPLFGEGVLRDFEIEGAVVDTPVYAELPFSPNSDLVIPGVGVPAGSVGNTDVYLVRRAQTGEYEYVTHNPTAEVTDERYGRIDNVSIRKDGEILIASTNGMFWHSETPTLIMDGTEQDPDGFPWGIPALSIPLDDGSIGFCCHNNAPVIANTTAITPTNPTPGPDPQATSNPRRSCNELHHSGQIACADDVRDGNGNPYGWWYTGQVGTSLTQRVLRTDPDGCGGAGAVYFPVVYTGGASYWNGCEFGDFGGGVRFSVGDEITNREGYTLSGLSSNFDVRISENGTAVAFPGTATGPDGPIEGIFVHTSEGLQLGSYIGQMVTLQSGEFAITDLLLANVNDAGQFPVTASFAEPFVDPETMTEVPRNAVLVVNQSAGPVPQNVALNNGFGKVRGDTIEYTADVENKGGQAVSEIQVVLSGVPDFWVITSQFCERGVEGFDAADVVCTYSDFIDGLLRPQEEGRFEFVVEFPPAFEEVDLSMLTMTVVAEGDTDTSDNSRNIEISPDIDMNARGFADAVSDGETSTLTLRVYDLGPTPGVANDLTETLQRAFELEIFYPAGKRPSSTANPTISVVDAGCAWETESEKDASRRVCNEPDVEFIRAYDIVVSVESLVFGYELTFKREWTDEDGEPTMASEVFDGSFDFTEDINNPEVSDDAPRSSSCATAPTHVPSPLLLLVGLIGLIGWRRRSKETY